MHMIHHVAIEIHTVKSRVPPGFNYHIWIYGRIFGWEEEAYGRLGEPAASFYLPTGKPAIADGFTYEDMIPILSSR